MTSTRTESEYRILGPIREGYEAILSAEAMSFVAALAMRFGPRVDELLARRKSRQAEIDAGEMPDFLPETAEIRAADWRVGEIPADLRDRRVEITGPVDRKMIINALNSGAKVFMADFEDSMTPSWDNLVLGQIALRDAVARTISFTSPEGKRYHLNERVATLFVRPRGWHLVEKHVEVGGRKVPGGLFDFGLYLFHNARATGAIGSGPYFYLPKLESHRRGAPLGRGVPVCRGHGSGSTRHHQVHGAHRDDPGRVRDRRDPVRAAASTSLRSTAAVGTTFSALSRSSRTFLSLHFQIATRSRWRRISCAPIRSW
jgi:malate synthase